MKKILKQLDVGFLNAKDLALVERQLLKDYKAVKLEHGELSRTKAKNDLNKTMLTDLSSCSENSELSDSFYSRW